MQFLPLDRLLYEPQDGSIVVFQCLEPQQTRKRCARYTSKSTEMRRHKCIERMGVEAEE